MITLEFALHCFSVWLYSDKRLNQTMLSRFAKLVTRQKRSKPIVDYRPALCFIQVHEVFRKRSWYHHDLFSTTYTYVVDYLSHSIEYSLPF